MLHSAAFMWILLCKGIAVNNKHSLRDGQPAFDGGVAIDEPMTWEFLCNRVNNGEYENEWDECKQMDELKSQQTLLEIASNGTHGPGDVQWTMTQLVLLAGGKGDPERFAGLDTSNGGRQFSEERWLVFLDPLLDAAEATTPAQQRQWWLSAEGEHTRWLARGGDLLCLLKSVDALAAPTSASASAAASLLASAAPAQTRRRSARLAGLTPATPMTTSIMSNELTLDVVQRMARLPTVLQRIVVSFARPTLAESISRLFAEHACGGVWDQAAFNTIVDPDC
jgi:hypothetical protein